VEEDLVEADAEDLVADLVVVRVENVSALTVAIEKLIN
jgi:hypothetical protein